MTRANVMHALTRRKIEYILNFRTDHKLDIVILMKTQDGCVSK